MVFALFVLPAVAAGLKAAASLKKHRRCRKKWKREAKRVGRDLGGLKARRVMNLNLFITDEERQMLNESPVGVFLANRKISQEAADFRQGRV